LATVWSGIETTFVLRCYKGGKKGPLILLMTTSMMSHPKMRTNTHYKMQWLDLVTLVCSLPYKASLCTNPYMYVPVWKKYQL